MSFETPPTLKRLGNIQTLRGIAALLVVFSHLYIIEQKYSQDQILGKWAELGMIGVDLFFVISGFIMVYITWNAARGFGAIKEFLFARVFRIYPLYWIVTLALICIWLWKPGLVFSSIEPKPSIVKSLLLWPDSRPPLLAVGWTLIHEMFFYLIFAISLLFSKRLLLPFLCVWAVVIAIGLVLDIAAISPVLAILFSPLSFEFLGGAIAAWVIIKVSPSRITGLIISLSGIAALILTAIFSYSNYGSIPLDYIERIKYFAIPCILIIFGIVVLERHAGKEKSSLSFLGDWSYGLYLTHVLSLSLFGRLWRLFDMPGWWDNIIILPILTVISIIVAYLSWRVIENPINGFVKTVRRKLFSAQNV